MGPGKGGELAEVSCVGSVIAITEMRVAFWESSKAQGAAFFPESSAEAGVGLPTEARCVKSVPWNRAKPKLTHAVNKNLKVLYSSFSGCFPLQYKRIIVFILSSIMGALWWIHENYGLWNVTFILRFLRELLVAFYFWPLYEICSWPMPCSRHQRRIFVVSKISMFWMPWDGIEMSHVKWLVTPCWCIGRINTWCF